MRSVLLWLGAGLVLYGAAPCAAAAQASPERRHLGVQLRGVVGPAYLHAVRAGSEESAIDGSGVQVEFALGHMVGERLALNMDLVVAHALSAEHGVLRDTTFTALHLGAGLTYWLMPANVYLAGSLGLARSSVEGEPVRVDIEVPTSDPSEIGAGLHLAAGKQWWVSRRVGLGLSLSLLSSVATDRNGGDDAERVLVGAALGFTVTLH